MIKIVRTAVAPQLVAEFRTWLIDEWGTIDAFEGRHPGTPVPRPIFALDGEQLIGGLAFTSAKLPDGKVGVWVNAVLVASIHRRKGVATELIEASKLAAAELGFREIHALTDIPQLYENLGWSVRRTTEDGSHVMGMMLN